MKNSKDKLKAGRILLWVVFLQLCLFMVSESSWGEMMMDETGMIMNANENHLPKDCQQISENVNLIIRAGHQYATKFKGKMFSYDQQEWNVLPCAKVNITFINDEEAAA